jgi:AraC-like DNA-binding protein
MNRATDNAPRQVIKLSTADPGATEDAFARLRKASADVADLTMLGSRDNFRFNVSSLRLGAADLLECRISALGCHRAIRHVARNAFDCLLVSLQLSGTLQLFCGNRATTVSAGDICLIDMAQPARVRVTEPASDGLAHFVMFALPRSLLAPLLAAPACVHGLVISSDTRYRRLLADHMVALWSSGSQLTDRESDAAIEALARLVTGGVLGSTHVQEKESVAGSRVLLSTIKSYIDARLGSAALDVDSLCRKFRLSRATLYRTFEADGSPGAYIQLRRLHRALSMLVSPDFKHWRIIDIAVECQFASDVAFIRAFRRLFGVTPGSARADPDKFRPATPASDQDKTAVPWRLEAEAAALLQQSTGAFPFAQSHPEI